MEEWGVSGVWGIKSRVLEDFRGQKGWYFDGFTLIGGGFWVK